GADRGDERASARALASLARRARRARRRPRPGPAPRRHPSPRAYTLGPEEDNRAAGADTRAAVQPGLKAEIDPSPVVPACSAASTQRLLRGDLSGAGEAGARRARPGAAA